MTNGERLAFYRKKNVMTQQQLGERLNVSAQAVSKWENDQSEPDIATLCKLAEIYQISVNELLGVSQPQKEPSAPVFDFEEEEDDDEKSNFVLSVFKKCFWALILVAVIGAGVMVFLKIRDTYEPERMLEKFEMIELGMTMDEVREIMGEPEETFKTTVTQASADAFSDAVWDAVLMLEEYGHLDCRMWYYRDARYEKAKKDAQDQGKELDSSKSWMQIRLVFNEEKKLIEAYCNTDFEAELWNDYGAGKKTVEEIIALDGTPEYYENLEQGSEYDFKVRFKDGSIYIGKLPISNNKSATKQDGTKPVTVETRWGTGEIGFPHAPINNRLPEDNHT